MAKKIPCFDNFQILKDKFDKLYNDNMSDAEQRAVGLKIALDYHKELHGELETFKASITKKYKKAPYVQPLVDTEKVEKIRQEYDSQIQALGGEQVAESKKVEPKVPQAKKSKPFVSKSGNQEVVLVNGELQVIDSKTKQEVSPKTRKKVLDEYVETVDFSEGKRAEEPSNEMLEKYPEDVIEGYVVDKSSNPLEVVEVFLRQKKVQNKPTTALDAGDKADLIANLGFPRIKRKGFERFGDRNLITMGMAKAYFGTAADKGLPIDTVAKSISDYLDVEITPGDLVQFMVAYPNGITQALKLKDNRVASAARDKFKELTGLNLTDEFAKQVYIQGTEQQNKKLEELTNKEYESRQKLEEEYWEWYAKTNDGTKDGDSAKVGTDVTGTEGKGVEEKGIEVEKPKTSDARKARIGEQLKVAEENAKSLKAKLDKAQASLNKDKEAMQQNMFQANQISLLNDVDAKAKKVSNIKRDYDAAKEEVKSLKEQFDSLLEGQTEMDMDGSPALANVKATAKALEGKDIDSILNSQRNKSGDESTYLPNKNIINKIKNAKVGDEIALDILVDKYLYGHDSEQFPSTQHGDGFNPKEVKEIKDPIEINIENIENPFIEALDGNHRIVQARFNKDKTIPAKLKIKKEIKEQADNFNLQKSISEAYHKAKADGSNPELVKAVEDLLSEQPTKEKDTKTLANKIRGLKADTKGKGFDATIGIPLTVYNTAIELVATSVEAGMKLANAIAKAMKYIDGQVGDKKWNKGMFAKEMNVRYSVTLPNGTEVEVERDTTNESAEVINGWYQPIEQAIIDSKQDVLPANKWAERLKSKEDEDLWTGVRDFLEKKGKDLVTKKELRDFIKENRIEIVEVVNEEKAKPKAYKRLDEIVEILNDRGYDIEVEDYGSMEMSVKGIDDGKLYLDTGRYYSTKEDLLKSGYEVKETYEEDVKLLEEAQKIASQQAISQEKQDTLSNTKFAQYQLEGEKENYKEVLVTLPSKETDKQFQSSHFEEANIIVHLRMNTRTDVDGNKVLFLEEVQGDFPQAYRKDSIAFEKQIKENYNTVLNSLISQGIIKRDC